MSVEPNFVSIAQIRSIWSASRSSPTFILLPGKEETELFYTLTNHCQILKQPQPICTLTITQFSYAHHNWQTKSKKKRRNAFTLFLELVAAKEEKSIQHILSSVQQASLEFTKIERHRQSRIYREGGSTARLLDEQRSLGNGNLQQPNNERIDGTLCWNWLRRRVWWDGSNLETGLEHGGLKLKTERAWCWTEKSVVGMRIESGSGEGHWEREREIKLLWEFERWR